MFKNILGTRNLYRALAAGGLFYAGRRAFRMWQSRRGDGLSGSTLSQNEGGVLNDITGRSDTNLDTTSRTGDIGGTQGSIYEGDRKAI